MFDLKNKLENIKNNNILRNFYEFSSPQNKNITLNDKNFLLFSSNNYLGFCTDSELKISSIETINKFGVGSGGSRLTTGTTTLHRECENLISKFKNKEDSILYSSGYLCNVGSISSLFYEDFVIFSDELNHSSIISGIKLTKSKCVIYKHSDINDLTKKIKENSSIEKKVIITDGVFSMDGDICKLNDLMEICYKFNCYLYIDDAHSTGVLGKTGAGTCEHFNISDEKIILMGTGSKALGCVGGFISSNSLIIDYLKNTSKTFIFSTSQTPENAKTLSNAIIKCTEYESQRDYLKKLSVYLRNSLRDIGYSVIDGITPIIPLILKDEKLCLIFQKELMNKNIFLTPIRPPSVPKNTSRLRITLCCNHTYEDINYLIDCLKSLYLKYEKQIKGEIL
ncbi:MAG TPA: aminotransferase class I/II-fold pyridoxal phosphate-dependent enzyme [Candidatus Dwaynia gallinarum]|nr:aminotransferase class I/II-fold pyridoxal phosphate-dependent enzyme [Candidatus Dwaynia gallinarum]